MDIEEIIKESKRLSISKRQTMIIESMKDLNDFEEIEDSIDVIKSKNEKKNSWNEAKFIFLT